MPTNAEPVSSVRARKVNRTAVIAWREWRTTVWRKEFLIVTLGVPVLALMVIGIVLATTASSAEMAEKSATTGSIGLYDPGHVLDPSALNNAIDGTRFILVKSLKAGQTEVELQNFRELIVIPADYISSGSFTIYRSAARGIFEAAGQSHDYAFTGALSKGLIGRRLPAALARRIVDPIGDAAPTILEWNPRTQRFARPDPVQQAAKFFVPYAFSMLLMMCIGIGTGYLLHGIIDEKENRVMEILLSSVTHEQLLRGKMIGLGAAGLTQIGVWVAMAGVPAAIALSMLPTSLRIPPLTLALCLVLFVLGFALYGSVMAGVGSLTSSWRESQQVTSVTIMVAIIPIILMTSILEMPNGPLARGLSWFPLTAPVALMMRIATGEVAPWDWGLGIALLFIAIGLVQKLTAKLFRLGLLMYGKPPTAREVWRWLKAA